MAGLLKKLQTFLVFHISNLNHHSSVHRWDHGPFTSGDKDVDACVCECVDNLHIPDVIQQHQAPQVFRLDVADTYRAASSALSNLFGQRRGVSVGATAISRASCPKIRATFALPSCPKWNHNIPCLKLDRTRLSRTTDDDITVLPLPPIPHRATVALALRSSLTRPLTASSRITVRST